MIRIAGQWFGVLTAPLLLYYALVCLQLVLDVIPQSQFMQSSYLVGVTFVQPSASNIEDHVRRSPSWIAWLE
ncbi:hypothetical protein SERLA73DRAFT_173645 [Serpula lacrymans var. lacrymans S7.3]|uniref:Uncharacterized protein n=1 Tax=Serpula lacrymans var. lacrymans (strain S7.3) TaxID=936435 RepID=F8PF99_SERL3|nr:hypothetical protein SERLA73DRAFT_173645 [Serpula lacrymans var. lacrymans S7.3]